MNETTTTRIGPVQLVAIRFGPDAQFEGRVLEELERLEQTQTIRLLDLLFVGRDAEQGELVALGYQGESLGGIVGALLGFDFDGVEEAPELDGEPLRADEPFGLGREQVLALAAQLDQGEAAAFMLFEHVWARDLKAAIRDAGGVPIGEGFLTPEAVAEVAVEIVAMAAELEALQAEADEEA
ncbi:MAG TPA: hypothetical protein VF250_01790 [Conexibacter sp.]